MTSPRVRNGVPHVRWTRPQCLPRAASGALASLSPARAAVAAPRDAQRSVTPWRTQGPSPVHRDNQSRSDGEFSRHNAIAMVAISLRCKRVRVSLSKWVAHGCLSPRRRASGIAAISREGTSRRVPQYCSALRLHHATAAAAAAAAAATGSRASATSCRQERQEEWRRGRRRGTRRSAQRHCCGQEAEDGHDSRHQRA
jgi:hypothetical protein